MFKVDQTLLIENLKKNIKSSYGVLIAISILEILMIVYGLITFNFNEPIRIVYFISYFVLLAASVTGIFLLTYYKKEKNIHRFKEAYYYSFFYVTLLCIWSTLISALDTFNGNFPFTFLTVFIAIPFFCLIDPIIYSLYGVIGTIALIITNIFYTQSLEEKTIDFGYYVNIVIFLLIVILATFKSYEVVVTRHKNEETLRIQSLTDQLTNVYNRRALDLKINELMNLKDKTNYSLILIDIDKFKEINDKFGHTYGDTCLKEVVKVISKYLSKMSLFRYGGDEFIVTTTLNRDEINYFINQINNDLRLIDNKVGLQISAGVYNLTNNDSKPDDILYKVDKALYESKVINSGKCVFFNENN